MCIDRRLRPTYEPTPEEIARECWKIRRTWSEREHRRRARIARRRVELTIVPDPHFDEPNPRSHEYDQATTD